MNKQFELIPKVSEILLSFYPVSNFSSVLNQVDELSEYLSSNSDLRSFLYSRVSSKDSKKQVLNVLSGTLDSYIVNSLCLLVDLDMIYYLDLFFISIRKLLYEGLKIQDVYVFSSYTIDASQRSRIEELWQKRFSKKTLNFVYAIDDSLRLGIKIQMGTYLEEFSLDSNFRNVKIKLDSLLV